MSGARKKDESPKEEGTSPSGFVEVTLGEVAFEGVMQNGPMDEEEFTYIDIGSIDRDEKVIVAPKVLTSHDAPSRAKQNLSAGDVLVSLTRPNLNAVAMISKEHDRSVGSTGFQVLRSKWVNSKFLYYLVQTDCFVDEMSALVQGALYPAIRPKDISSFKFLLPSSLYQSRIVAKLEELLSDLDAGVAALKAAQAKLGEYRQSLLKAAVDGSLTAEWRKSHTPAESGTELLERILTERRKRWEAKQLAKFQEQGKTPPKGWQDRYPQPVSPDTTNLPKLPEGWVWASAEQLCEFITKGTTPPKGADVGDKVIPFLRVTNLTDRGELDMSDKVFVSRSTHEGFLSRSIVYPNDVLMNIVGPPLGQVAIVPKDFDEWNINQAIAIFRAVPGVEPDFLSHVLLSTLAQIWLKSRSKTTAGQTNLTLETCRALPFPLPSQAEQLAVIEAFGTVHREMAGQQVTVERVLRSADAQRKNILKAAFSGKLVPQDPNDEPASVLLERIRDERVLNGTKGTRRGRNRGDS